MAAMMHARAKTGQSGTGPISVIQQQSLTPAAFGPRAVSLLAGATTTKAAIPLSTPIADLKPYAMTSW